METTSAFWDFGPYGSYIYAAVAVTLIVMGALLWQSLRQLSQQKKSLHKSEGPHET